MDTPAVGATVDSVHDETSPASDLLRRVRDALADQYVLVGEIGRGGMGAVYVGLERDRALQVAIKVVLPGLPSRTARQRFRHEIAISSMLAHPHIVPVLDSGDVGDHLYYVMPLVDGESLQRRLKREPRLTVEEVANLTREVAEALAHAHERGIVHRDIKPANILIDDGEAKVLDFGVALACAACGLERLTTAGYTVGTPRYMSPEQALGETSLDHRTDIYSLGCVVYEMLVGEPPVTWPDSARSRSGRLSDVPFDHRQALSRLPPAVEPVLAKALAKAPEDRYASAPELSAALAQALSGKRPGLVTRLRGWMRLLESAVVGTG